jgi:hypothetical protein
MKKQTALQWLISEWPILESQIPQRVIDIAVEIEKMQIINAHGDRQIQGREDGVDFWQQITGEQYYKENYEREDNKH